MQLDQFQEQARLDRGDKVLLVAPPGSGKTTVLLAKIEYLVEECQVEPDRILVLTFSRSASENMKDRYHRQRKAVGPAFGTIHALAYREIRSRKGGIELISPAQAIFSLHQVRRQYFLSLQESTDCLSDISRERATGHFDPSIPERFRQQVREAYGNYKAERKLRDFDDLEEEFLEMLEDEMYRITMQHRYDWIMVDEFQDLNRVQLRILKILSKDCHLFCVGDEDQCIYAFRGSDTAAMVNFAREFDGGQILYLQYNYRSSATIVRHANQVIACNQARYPKVIDNFRQDESSIRIRSFSSDSASTRFLISHLYKLGSRRTAALIFRTNSELEETAHQLLREKLRFSCLDHPPNRYDRRLLRNLIDFLTYSQNAISCKVMFFRLLATLPLHLSPEVITRCVNSERWSEQDLLNDQIFDLTPDQRQGLDRLFKGFRKLRTMEPGTAIRYILYVMGYSQWIRRMAQGTGAILQDLIREAEDFAAEAACFGSVPDFLEFIRTWDGIMSEKGAGERILLSTMHGVKGMEFDEVLLVNAVEGSIPHEKSMDDLEAERRLFYVAITRAMHDLTILVPASRQGRAVEPSRFLKELGLPMEDESPVTAKNQVGGIIRMIKQKIRL